MSELTACETSRGQIQIITLTSVNKNDIEFTDGEREFRYKGEMYDLVRTEKKGKTLLLYCIGDKKETNLIAQLNLNTEMQSYAGSSNNSSKNILKIFTQEYITPQFFSFNIHGSLRILGKHDAADLYQHNFPSLNSPPPKTV